MKARLHRHQHHKTKNSTGFMHPVTTIGNEFALFSKTASPVADIGCAYGNTVIAALDAGAEHVIACDMEREHLTLLLEQLDEAEQARVTLKLGTLPRNLDFTPNSLAGIHVSLVLPYLTTQELDEALQNLHVWLKPNGKVFILCYTIFIKELANSHFEIEYKKRQASGKKWPGYLENFNEYSYTNGIRNEQDTSTFPVALHFFDVDVLVRALQDLNFIIESAQYLDGRTNGAVEDTWHDSREFVGIIARKPFFHNS